eukprot:COSAG02_NODE_57360_length_281_cov_0.571429_1_plen_38_part_01
MCNSSVPFQSTGVYLSLNGSHFRACPTTNRPLHDTVIV